jgi:hypothetical protein
MKEKDRFDFEQEIMGAWNIIEDLKCLLDGWDTLTEDKKMNIIIGLVDLYDLRFDTLFKTFEQLISQKFFVCKYSTSLEDSLNREYGQEIMRNYEETQSVDKIGDDTLTPF